MVFKKSSVAYLKSLRKKKDANASDINDVILLYQDRKIPRLDTAELMILQLQSRGKATQEKAKRKLDTFRGAESVKGKLKREQKHAEDHKLDFKVSGIKTSMQDRFVAITVQPEHVGPLAGLNLKTFFLNAFHKAKEAASNFKKNKLTTFRATAIFPFEEAGDKHATFPDTRLSMDPVDFNKRVANYVERISKLLQSWQKVAVSELKFYFQFYYVPAGGGSRGTESRAHEDIYRKSSVIRIRNQDNSCFWRALAVILIRNDKHIAERETVQVPFGLRHQG